MNCTLLLPDRPLGLSAGFSVTAASPTPTIAVFRRATLQFNPANATKETVTTDNDNILPDLLERPAQLLFSFCWPPDAMTGSTGTFTVSAEGALSGQCTAGQEDPSSVPDEVLPPNYLLTTLTGNFDRATNTVSFAMAGAATQFFSSDLDGVMHPPVVTYGVTVDGRRAGRGQHRHRDGPLRV